MAKIRYSDGRFARAVKLLLALVTGLFVLSSYCCSAQSSATINPSINWGVWEGWGCSLCWWANVLGTNKTLSDILFTTHYTAWNGTNLPGLGMNIIRYNAGASSSNSYNGVSMFVTTNLPWFRAMPSYWTDWGSANPTSSSWNWTVDAHQRAALLNARARGANIFELFANSPPWWMCYNHDPCGATNGTSDNLPPSNYDQHAIYLATVAQYARDHWGFFFTSVEAFNEPIADWWTWHRNQEGCHFNPGTQAAVIGPLRAELNNRGLASTIISASDESTYDMATNTWNSFDTATRAKVGRINVHGYQNGGGRRDVLYAQAQAAGKDLWNSEYGEGDASGLTLMTNLNLDFRILHNKAWCYWQPFDDEGWGLIHCDLPGWPDNVNTKYYVLAQYTRHIRPGMTIIDGGNPNVVAAYDSAHKKLAIVCGNDGAARQVTIDLARFKTVNGPITRWATQTSGAERYMEHKDTTLSGKAFQVSFAKNSIQTFEIQNVAP
jgi:galactan endo-1,6-beta-galactosidase